MFSFLINTLESSVCLKKSSIPVYALVLGNFWCIILSYILEFHQREKFFKSSLAPSRVHCKLYSLSFESFSQAQVWAGAMEQAGLAQGCVTTWVCYPELMPGRGEWRVGLQK